MRVYLSGAINRCTDEEASGWRRDASRRLAILEPRIQCVDPMRRDYRGREAVPGIARRIVQDDLVDIAACDAVLASCPRPSWGTAMEIRQAHVTGKFVVTVVSPEDLARGPSPWLVEHSSVVVCDYADAVYALVDHFRDLFYRT